MAINFNFLLKPIFAWLNYKRPVSDVPLSHFDRICEEVQPCDVLLVEGRSRVSDVIKLVTQSPWSHAALYIGRIRDIDNPRLHDLVKSFYAGSEDEQLILESELGLGTLIRPITAYDKEHIRICRPRGLLPEDAHDVIRYAVSQVGSEYDVRQILDLARFLLPWRIMPRRWRSSLFNTNVGNVTKTVCSTLIAEAFGFVQFPILPLVKLDKDNNVQLYRRNPKLTVPSLFDYSPYFEIIKYPFLDYGRHENYHLLPWQGSVEMHYSEVALYSSFIRDEKKGEPDDESDSPSVH
jgi:hypothetical protein